MRNALILATLAGLSLGCGSPRLDEAERLLAAGEYLRAQGIAELESTSHPKEARAHFIFAKASLFLAQPEIAKAAFERALPLEPRLQVEVGGLYLEAARRLFADHEARAKHAVAIKAYLEAAQKYGFRTTPDIDAWIARAGSELVTPEESFDRLIEERLGIDLGTQIAKHKGSMEDMLDVGLLFSCYIADNPVYPDVSDPARLPILFREYLQGEFPFVDRWGTPFRFEVSPDRQDFRIISAAADRLFDTREPLPWGKRFYELVEGRGWSTSPADDIIFDGWRIVQGWEAVLGKQVREGEGVKQ